MASLTKCDRSSKSFVQERMRNITSIISSYGWIIDAYVSDFYTKGFWSSLPSSLQTYFDSVEPPDLAWLLSCYNGHSQTCCSHLFIPPPLSLLALRQCISFLALQRRAVDTEEPSSRQLILTALSCKKENTPDDKVKDTQDNSCSTDRHHEQRTAKQEKILVAPSGSAPKYKNGQCMDMQHIFRKHVKPKKQHEINSLGQVISLVGQAAECSVVIDVGAGLGHLARLLAFQHGLRVTTIEAAGSHAPKASEFDKDLWKSINKAKVKKNLNCNLNSEQSPLKPVHKREDKERGTDASASIGSAFDKEKNTSESYLQDDLKAEFHEGSDAELPSHVICTVQPDIAAAQFLDIVVNRKSSGEHLSENCDGNFILVSLHACGDLTPTLLRVFLSCPTARGLASVACCYMKMSASTSSHSSGIDNFPMSTYLQDLPFQSLSYEAREMACHFADAYHQRLIDNPVHLKIHSYRAALQRLVIAVDPNFRSGQARLISKKGASVTFAEYAAENLKKLGISVESVPEGLMHECAQLTRQWKRVVGFYTLRLSLAPLVETLLLCDRALFLLEHGIPSVLVPIFDPSVSPRNFALLALKP